MRRLSLCCLLAVLGFFAVIGCGGDGTSNDQTPTASKEEIDKAMQKLKKMGPNAHK